MSTASVLSDFFTAALREARSERPASLASRTPASERSACCFPLWHP